MSIETIPKEVDTLDMNTTKGCGDLMRSASTSSRMPFFRLKTSRNGTLQFGAPFDPRSLMNSIMVLHFPRRFSDSGFSLGPCFVCLR